MKSLIQIKDADDLIELLTYDSYCLSAMDKYEAANAKIELTKMICDGADHTLTHINKLSCFRLGLQFEEAEVIYHFDFPALKGESSSVLYWKKESLEKLDRKIEAFRVKWKDLLNLIVTAKVLKK